MQTDDDKSSQAGRQLNSDNGFIRVEEVLSLQVIYCVGGDEEYRQKNDKRKILRCSKLTFRTVVCKYFFLADCAPIVELPYFTFFCLPSL